MQAFEHAAPGDLKQALGLLSSKWGETDILAGGTDLLSLMKERIHTPKRVVSLSSIDGLGGIESSADGLRIGATATLDDLLASTEVQKNYSALVHAAEGVSSPQIRAMGTVGGDLLQRPRCWYFRNGLGLLAKDPKGNSLVPRRREPLPCHSRQQGAGLFRERFRAWRRRWLRWELPQRWSRRTVNASSQSRVFIALPRTTATGSWRSSPTRS